MIWSAYTPDAKNPEKRWVWGPKWPPLSGLFHHSQEKEKRRKEKEIQENLKKNGKTWEKEKQQNERLWGIIQVGFDWRVDTVILFDGSMKNYLQALIERARALNEKVSDEINTSCSSFCRFCSESGCYCGDAETPFEERQRLIAIGDSLKNVEKMLVFLQVHEFVSLHRTFLFPFFSVNSKTHVCD